MANTTICPICGKLYAWVYVGHPNQPPPGTIYFTMSISSGTTMQPPTPELCYGHAPAEEEQQTVIPRAFYDAFSEEEPC